MIDTVACESDYLKAKFFPARPFVQEQIEFNREKLHCLAPNAEDWALNGMYDEPLSSSFSIFFTSCDTLWNANCKSVEEVTEWLAHKYVIVVYTERRFSQETGLEILESKMVRLPINKITNTHYRFQIEVTHLVDLDNLENNYWPSGDRSYEDFYRVKQLPD